MAASVIGAILERNRALVAADIECLKEQYQANVRTELRDVERVEIGGEPGFSERRRSDVVLGRSTNFFKSSLAIPTTVALESATDVIAPSRM